MKTTAPHPIAVCSLALKVASTGGMTRLMPAGKFEAPRGALSGSGPWFLDAALATRIIARASARSTDIVIDWEHQTLLAEKNGKPAPASGWIDRRSLEYHDDGLYGLVKWTDRAQAAIDADEYRYLSPVFPYDAKSGHVLDLLHVGLTNNPAIDTAISALAAARMGSGTYDLTSENDNVDRKKLIELLGLAAEATDEEIIAALEGLITKAGDADEAVAKAEDAAQELAAARSGGFDMSKYVPRAVYDEQKVQLAALRSDSNSAELNRLIDDGLKDGRIPGKATADWLRSQGIAACKAHLEGSQPIAALTRRQSHGREKGTTENLTADEIAICRATGVSASEYRKANPAQD